MKKSLVGAAILLGLAWAVRGHFGHEWGAAWAGAVGGLALVVASGRTSWLQQLPYLGALSAVGWGVGGMMSYGVVIGYCRGDDFGNVLYGYTMLAVIGGLYGAIGGGFLGLGLESSKERKPAWASLLTEMVAGGLLVWGLLIYQLEWFMTPPRSELWAACLGATMALLWYCKRNGFLRAYRISLLTALGAGFGFSFGNFIQGVGAASGISYNWWNVMEFTLGFCGGLTMAYAVATSHWDEEVEIPCSKTSSNLALVFILLFVPITNLTSAFTPNKISRVAEMFGIQNDAGFTTLIQTLGITLLITFVALGYYLWRQKRLDIKRASFLFMAAVASHYVLLGMLLKGFFLEIPRLNNSVSTYLPLLVAGLWLTMRGQWNEIKQIALSERSLYIILILTLFVIAWVSISINPELEKVNRRF